MRPGAALLLALAAAGCSNAPPLRVIEEHHEMVLLLHEARARGVVTAPVTLVHIDAHADLGRPALGEPLTARADENPEEHRRRVARLVECEFGVDDVILPSVLLGLVGEVIWVTPDWLGESPRVDRFEVGSRGGRGREIVSGETLDEVVHPDRRPFRMAVVTSEGLPAVPSPWVLGIDLDAFLCRNPHADHVDREATEAEARGLLDRGEVVDRGRAEEAGRVVRSTLVRIDGGAMLRRVDRVESPEGIRWVIGWRCMGEAREGLPVHHATSDEVAVEVDRLARALARMPWPPVLVVICRSARSGFVPANRVHELQTRVVNALAGIDWSRGTGYPLR